MNVSMLVGIVMPSLVAFTLNWPWVYLVSLAAAALIFGGLYPQRYETLPDALVIKTGRTTRVIQYDQIERVELAPDGRLFLSVAAFGGVLIAPVDPRAFLDDITQRVPRLKANS